MNVCEDFEAKYLYKYRTVRTIFLQSLAQSLKGFHQWKTGKLILKNNVFPRATKFSRDFFYFQCLIISADEAEFLKQKRYSTGLAETLDGVMNS